MVALPERNILELIPLLAILETKRRIGRKYLELLVGELCSMHISVPGAVVHLYHIQRSLDQRGVGVNRAWLLPTFHW